MGCSDHLPIWVEAVLAFECGKCRVLLHTASGLCRLCQQPIDAHVLVNVEQPVCPERKVAA